MRQRICHCSIARTFLVLAFLLLPAYTTLGQGDPPGCAGSGVGLNVEPFIQLGGGELISPPNGVVKKGDMILYRVMLSQPLPNGCNYIGGQLSLTLPNGMKICLAGFDEAGDCDDCPSNPGDLCPTPAVPLIGFDVPPGPFTIDCPVLYQADNDDADDRVLTVRVDYGPTAFEPQQEPGTVLSKIPTPANSATIAFPLTLGNLVCVAPPDENVECITEVPPAARNFDEFIRQGGSVDGNCPGQVTVMHISDVSDGKTCPERITRTYQVMDDCDGVAECTQNITILDITDPEITCPKGIEVQCLEEVPDPDTSKVICTDNCSSARDLKVMHVKDTMRGTCPTIVIRTYSCTDLCNNTATCEQMITVLDERPPTIVCPPDEEIECPDMPRAPASNVDEFIEQGGTVDDACGVVSITHLGDDDDDDGVCPSAIFRSYEAEDECGNTATCVQIFTLIDTTDPEITCPDDVVLECPADTDPRNTGFATCTDDCPGRLVVDFTDKVIPGECPQEFTIERTWVCFDACRNSDMCVQIIEVVDTTDPEIMCPPDVTINADESSDPENTGEATCFDACDPDPMVTFEDKVVPGGKGVCEIIERTWTCIDACGNEDECVQMIAVTGRSSIGDYIWEDLNRDGLQDSDEVGIDGVTVNLFLKVDGDLVFITDTVTFNNGMNSGFYEFTGLCAGDYRVAVKEDTLPKDYVPSPPNVGDNDEIDSDCIGGSVQVTLPDNMTDDPTIDCGFFPPGDCDVKCIVEEVMLPDDDDDDDDGDDGGDDGGDDDDSDDGGVAGDDDGDDSNDDDGGDGPGGGKTLLQIFYNVVPGEKECDDLNAVIDIGCAEIKVDDGQLVDLVCAPIDDGGDDDGDDSNDDDGGDDDDGDDSGVAGGDDDDDDNGGGGGGGDCFFQFVGDVLVIRSDMAVLRVTATGANGDALAECDLCEFIGDPGNPDDGNDDSDDSDDGDDDDDSAGGAASEEAGRGGVETECRADLNGDRIVSTLDLVLMIQEWGSESSNSSDINEDGIVDVGDMTEMIIDWGVCQD